MIRPATLEDTDAIYAVHTAAVRGIASHYLPSEIDAWSGRQSRDTFTTTLASRLVIVEEDGTDILGFGQLDPVASLVEAIYVAPHCWRHGVGSRLLAALEDSARAAGKSQLTLDASLNSVPFYESAGYRSVANASHQLSGSGTSIACVIMQKQL